MSHAFKVNNFDLLRIFAASQVALVHAIAHLKLPAPKWLVSLIDAFPGVPIFFVISGFLISAAYQRSPSIEKYARNRALRIFPALWCCIAATVIVAALFGHWSFSLASVGWFFSQLIGLIYTPGFLKSFGFGSYNGALWTIPIELQFYALLPVLYWAMGKLKPGSDLPLWQIWAVFVVIAIIATQINPPIAVPVAETAAAKLFRYSFLPHFFLFLTGVLLQRLQFHQLEFVRGQAVIWIIGYLAFYFLLPDSAVKHVAAMLLLGVVSIVVAFTAPETSERWLGGNDISYGVYIYHGLVLNVFVELGWVGRWSLVPVFAGATLLAGYLSWVLVERRFLQRKTGAMQPAAPLADTTFGRHGPAE